MAAQSENKTGTDNTIHRASRFIDFLLRRELDIIPQNIGILDAPHSVPIFDLKQDYRDEFLPREI
jgi:hypothetical protein